MGSQSSADFVVQIAKVISSSIAEAPDGSSNRPVQYAVAGVGAPDDLMTEDGEIGVTDDEGGRNENADVFSALGMTGRPLPPSTSGETSEHAEVICVRQVDGLLPIATRDVRLRMGGNAPNEGTVALVGYGGGYHAISPLDNDDLTKGAIQVIYCPYDFNASGVAQKAHSISLNPDTTDDSITIVHAEGMAITMSGQDKKAVVLKNAAGDVSISLDDDGITLNGNVICNGSMIVGNPATAVPLLAGPASPPSTVFYVSPA